MGEPTRMRQLLPPLAVVALVLLILRLIPLPLEQVFVVLFTAVLLAAAVTPAADFFEQFRVPRGITVMVVYLVGFLVLAGVVAMIVPLVSGEVKLIRDQVPVYNRELRDLVQRFAPDLADNFKADQFINTGVEQLTSWAGRATDLALALSAVFVRLIIVLVMGYFMAVEADFAERVIARFTPPHNRERAHRLLSAIGNRLGHWARAQLLLALYFGVMFGIGLRVVGVPYATTLGVIGGAIEIIPYIGGAATLVLAILVASTQSPWLILWVGVWYTVVVQTQAHVLAPFLMGRAVGMHPLVVVVALFIGVEAVGVFGALLAVPIAVVMQALLDEFYRFDELTDSSASDLEATHSIPMHRETEDRST